LGATGDASPRSAARSELTYRLELFLTHCGSGILALVLLGISTPDHGAAAGQLIAELGLGAAWPIVAAILPFAAAAFLLVVWTEHRRGRRTLAVLAMAAACLAGALGLSAAVTPVGRGSVAAALDGAEDPVACALSGDRLSPACADAHEDLHELAASPLGPLAALLDDATMLGLAAVALAAVYGLWLPGAAVAGGYLALWLLAWRETRELPDRDADVFVLR
jgi:hypothetical protein